MAAKRDLGWMGGMDGPGLACPWPILGMGGRIEPAEPEPPPAHSIGRVGRAGQFVRPCWLGVLVSRWWCGAGGEELVARLVVRLAFSTVFCNFWSSWA